MENIPALDFDKEDYIQHINLNSNILSEDIGFLNLKISEVYRTYHSSSSENLQRALTIVASSDILTPFLHGYSQAINLVELLCDEPELSIAEINLSDSIKIIPNPIVDNFTIQISNNLTIDEMILYDVTGKTIIRQNINGLNYIALINYRLDSGIYFFKFISVNHSTVKKIILK